MFRMIGYYEIARDGDVIHVRSASEFNLEAAQQYARDMMDAIEAMPLRFATLVEFDEPPIIGPEVEEAMRQSARVRAQRGMVAVAFVVVNQEAISVASAQWGRIYDGSGVVFRIFADVAPARAWLQEQVDAAR